MRIAERQSRLFEYSDLSFAMHCLQRVFMSFTKLLIEDGTALWAWKVSKREEIQKIAVFKRNSNDRANDDLNKSYDQIFSGTNLTAVVPLIRPVLLAAIRPTFWPAEANLLIVPGLPKCLWLPPPWGWSTGFILTPPTTGNLFLCLLYLWKRVPAFMIGFSFLPPPAMIPTVALQLPLMVFLAPEGSLILVLDPSSECPTIVA